MTKVFTLVSLLLMMACMGTTARNETLIPAMLITWQSSIAESVILGGGDPKPMEAALRSKDVKLILAQPWGPLRDQAMMGIRELQRTGDIGPNVALIMMNEIAMFDRAMHVLAGHAKLVTRRIGIPAGDVTTYTHLYPRKPNAVR